MHLSLILVPFLLSFHALGAPVTSDESTPSLEVRKTPLHDLKYIKPYLLNKVKAKILPKILPRNTKDLDARNPWTKVSRRDIPAADINNGTDDEGDFDITDTYSPVDGYDEIDGDDEINSDDLLDKRDTPTDEDDETAPVKDDVEENDKDEIEDQYFTDLYGADDDDIEDEN